MYDEIHVCDTPLYSNHTYQKAFDLLNRLQPDVFKITKDVVNVCFRVSCINVKMHLL